MEGRTVLLNDEALGSKGPDDNIDAVARLYESSFIGEGHPIHFAGLWRAALTQLADLFERGHNQLNTGARIDQRWLAFLVIEGLCLLSIEHTIAETNDLTGLRRSYG